MSNVTKLTPRPHGGVVEHAPIETVKIQVVTNKRGPGYAMHDVHIGPLVLHAIDHNEACQIAYEIAHIIENYTVDGAEIVGKDGAA